MLACAGSDSKPHNPGPNLNIAPAEDNFLLQIFLIADVWQNEPERWDALVYARLGERDFSGNFIADTGRLFELLTNEAYGYNLSLQIGDQSFSLNYSDSEQALRLVPAATTESILNDFSVPRSSYQLIDSLSFEELFSRSIELRSPQSSENLLFIPQASNFAASQASNLRTPQALLNFNPSIQSNRVLSNCDTDEMVWNGSESGSNASFQFFDSYFQSEPEALTSQVFVVLDTGSTQAPFVPGPSGQPVLFEQLFPDIEPSTEPLGLYFDRSITRSRVFSGASFKGFESQGLRVEIFVEKISRFEFRYQACE